MLSGWISMRSGFTLSYVENVVMQQLPTHSSLDLSLSVLHSAFSPAVAQLMGRV